MGFEYVDNQLFILERALTGPTRESETANCICRTITNEQFSNLKYYQPISIGNNSYVSIQERLQYGFD